MKTHSSTIQTPITIDRPMVIISTEEYVTLLKEAGHLPTPILDQKIAQARARFQEKKFIKWEKLKDELLQCCH